MLKQMYNKHSLDQQTKYCHPCLRAAMAEWLRSWLAEQEVWGSISPLATWISEIGYLPLPSRDMAEITLKRRKSSIHVQPTNTTKPPLLRNISLQSTNLPIYNMPDGVTYFGRRSLYPITIALFSVYLYMYDLVHHGQTIIKWWEVGGFKSIVITNICCY